MAQHRSIAQRLAKTNKPAIRREILNDWSLNWENDQLTTIHQLEQAIKNNDHALLCKSAGQLKAITEKRFDGLSNIFSILLSD
ncbi:MAG: hypothetical protein AB1403_01735 [Candidatus Riflebacteria bacterium]